MREQYADVRPDSDFEEDENRKSLQHLSAAIKDAHQLAELELFREKLKSMYHYRNIYVEVKDKDNNQKPKPNVTRRAQTYEVEINPYHVDPFEEDDEFLTVKDDDLLLDIDSNLPKQIIDRVIDAISRGSSYYAEIPDD